MPAQAADASAHANRPQWLNYQEGDFVIRNYVFRSGGTLPELKWVNPFDLITEPGSRLLTASARAAASRRRGRR